MVNFATKKIATHESRVVLLGFFFFFKIFDAAKQMITNKKI